MFLRRVNGLINAISVAAAKYLLAPDHNNGTIQCHFIETINTLPLVFTQNGGYNETINADNRHGILSMNVQTVNNYRVMYSDTWSVPPISINNSSKLELQYTFKLNILPTATEDYVVMLGFSNAINGTYPTNGIYARYSNATGGKLECVCIIDGVATTSTINVTLNNTTWYTLLINYNLTNVTFTLVNSNITNTITTNIPVGKYLFYITAIKKLLGSTNIIKFYIDYFRLTWSDS